MAEFWDRLKALNEAFKQYNPEPKKEESEEETEEQKKKKKKKKWPQWKDLPPGERGGGGIYE